MKCLAIPKTAKNMTSMEKTGNTQSSLNMRNASNNNNLAGGFVVAGNNPIPGILTTIHSPIFLNKCSGAAQDQGEPAGVPNIKDRISTPNFSLIYLMFTPAKNTP